MFPMCALRFRNLELMKGTFLNVPVHVNCMSMQNLAHQGMLDLVISGSTNGCAECNSRSRVPFFLRDMDVAGIYICPDADVFVKTQHASSTIRMCEEDAEMTMFHPRKSPSFENICGSVYLSCMMPLQNLPPRPDERIFRGGKVLSRKRGGRSLLLQNKFATEIFTIHGNLVLKRSAYGTVVNFKVSVSFQQIVF